MSFHSTVREIIDIFRDRDNRPYSDHLLSEIDSKQIDTSPFRRNSNIGKIIQIYEDIYPVDKDIKVEFLSKLQAKYFHERRPALTEDSIRYSYKILPFQRSWVKQSYPKLFIDMDEISLLLEYVYFIDETLCGTFIHSKTRKLWMLNLLSALKHDFDGSYLYKEKDLSKSWLTVKTLGDLEHLRSTILELSSQKLEFIEIMLDKASHLLKANSPNNKFKLEQFKDKIKKMIDENTHDLCKYSALSNGSGKYRPDGFLAFPEAIPHEEYVLETKGLRKRVYPFLI